MQTRDKENRFVALNQIDYHSLPWDELHEAEHNITHKEQWLDAGIEFLDELAKRYHCHYTNSKNRSGTIDRGYVSGFMGKEGKCLYISIGDGMQSILFRSAKNFTDYTGGSNNHEPITHEGVERMERWIENYFKS